MNREENIIPTMPKVEFIEKVTFNPVFIEQMSFISKVSKLKNTMESNI